MRVVLFTDTLGDVNGVSRFIQNIARHALDTGRELHVVTSSNIAIPSQPNIHNLPPVYARRMPRYHHLELAFAPRGRAARLLDELAPDVVHVSTPGPVGRLGRRLALERSRPLVGVYHTDFPAYIEHLMKSRWLGRVCAWDMARFYRPFARVLTRSAAYVPAVERLGIDRARIVPLRPGIETSRFRPHFRDAAVWASLGVPGLDGSGVNILTTTRVSVEKNMPMLVEAWLEARERLAALGARLIVVGDGPYRAAMERRLAGSGAFFLGFRHGEELSRLYASSDLFVFPSATDTLGQVVMEAQASGLAALVTDQGGPKEIVEHGVSGLVLPANDPRAWSAAIIELASDAARREAMGRAAAARLSTMTLAASFEHYWQVHEEARR